MRICMTGLRPGISSETVLPSGESLAPLTSTSSRPLASCLVSSLMAEPFRSRSSRSRFSSMTLAWKSGVRAE